MSLIEQVDKDYIAAYKAKDTLRVSVLRMLKAAVKNRLVELYRPGGTLSDEEMLDVIIKEGKQRRDSITEYTKAGRTDLADKEAAELAILETYLPRALGPEALAQVIEEAIAATHATSPREMGKVMGAILSAHKGQVDGKALSAAVRERLSRQG